MNKISPYLFLFALPVVFIAGCESDNSFRSEGKLRLQIQAAWDVVPLDTGTVVEYWYFDGDRVSRIRPDNNPSTNDTIGKGNYTVNTTILKPFLSIDGLNSKSELLDGKWEIIELDADIMVLALKPPEGQGGLVERDFTKKKN